jgi:transposase
MDDVTLLQQRLRESEERCEALQNQVTSILAQFATFRHDYEALAETTRAVVGERDLLKKRVAELEVANKRLVDMLWGRRSERRSDSPDQMQLAFAAESPSVEQQEIITAQTKADEATDDELLRRLKASRKARREQRERKEEFPPGIERRERTIDLSEEEKKGLKRIGEKVTERLCFEKPHVYIDVIIRPEYVVAGEPEKGVRSASPPLSIIEGCKYDFSVIAAIFAMKFAFHMPTYRQQDWFGQCGWFPSRSTANDLVNYTVATIAPLHRQMWHLLLRQPILLGDDTRIRVLLRGELSEEQLENLGKRSRFRQTAEAAKPPPGSALSYAWLYTGLDGFAPYNVFHWSLGHENAVIDGHLATYRGTFVGDASGVNARLQQRSDGRIVHASCNAHARREFVKAESNDPILASQAISFYRQLYDVEERAATLDAAGRLELRQRDAVPIWNRMERWLAGDAINRVLPRSAIGEAVGYMRNQWTALRRYLSDGNIPIDNDQSERTIRPLTVGRNNWLFLGHPDAAPGRMQMVSVVSSAHRHHLVIEDYLEDVLRKLADAEQNHPADLAVDSPYLLDLLPDRWALTHPASVRTGRIEERKDALDAKRLRRVRARIEARAAQSAGL